MTTHLSAIKAQILAALSHPEAEVGLYFRNFAFHHEEDERPLVEGQELEILDALKELIDEGRVVLNDEGEEAVFLLAHHSIPPEFRGSDRGNKTKLP